MRLDRPLVGGALSTGTHYRLTFTGQAISGDQAALIDAVSVAAVLEPPRWMMMTGFGGAPFARRRRPALRTAAAGQRTSGRTGGALRRVPLS